MSFMIYLREHLTPLPQHNEKKATSPQTATIYKIFSQVRHQREPLVTRLFPVRLLDAL
jgi:hypothetical protein